MKRTSEVKQKTFSLFHKCSFLDIKNELAKMSQTQPLTQFKSWFSYAIYFASGELIIFANISKLLLLFIGMQLHKRELWHYVKSVEIWSFYGFYFPVFSPNTRKYGAEKTPYFSRTMRLFLALSNNFLVFAFYIHVCNT